MKQKPKETFTRSNLKPWIPKGFVQTFINPTHMNCLQCCNKLQPFLMSDEQQRKDHFLQDPRNHLPVLLARIEKTCKSCGYETDKKVDICKCGNDKFW